MPIYEYRCTTCNHEFEEFTHSARGRPRVECPACGGRRVERRLSVFAAHQGSPQGATQAGQACGRCGDPNGPCGF
jgi:putative FmdB family regulatory protein